MNFLKLFKRQIQVARVFGIPVRIDYRWFLIFALSAWVIAESFEQGTIKTQRVQVGALTAWVAGIATTFGLFLSIFGHELSHALVASAEGIESEEIVLHPFGGLTRLKREPDNPRAEFRIAIAGPSASFLIGLVALVGFYAASLLNLRTLAAALSIVGFWNFVIAASNLLPGYPLDGGRVLRAYLWHFFLFDAARAVTGGGRRRGRGLRTVGEAMTAPVVVEPDTLVSHFVDNVLSVHRQEAVAVARARRLHGILTLSDLKQLPRESWHRTRVSEVMRPVASDLFVDPSTPLARAEKLMSENGAGALAVINAAGELVGFLLRGSLKRRVKVKA
ncbi:MAG: M50 family metallopeptidase [Acidobacteria bacterium]|nr:M50 family metallopeptidase [Acidobacteriota bacterium]